MGRFAKTLALGVIVLCSSRHTVPSGFEKFDSNRHIVVEGQFAMKSELIVGLLGQPDEGFSVDFFNEFKTDGLSPAQLLLERKRDTGDVIRYFLVKDLRHRDYSEVAQNLSKHNAVTLVQPNYVYNINFDPREYTPNDPSFAEQYHHTLMKNDQAWDISSGDSKVLIAIADDGFALSHTDLSQNIWRNDLEIENNGIDDDNNGYVDDIRGWDFCNKNNDPTNNSSSDTHGTHVAGIAASRIDNSIGVAGTAGTATIMPLQFYGGCQWTSAVIAETYKYAANNGAKILSTSYNIDKFTNDRLFDEVLTYIHDKGVLALNSAGNNSIINPPRFKFTQLLMVASSDMADKKSSFSNYGQSIDITAPGSDILSTLPPNRWSKLSGTSMATPNAAGVAALIWSARPNLTRDQVAALLYFSADSIDTLNPTFAGMLGKGRANSFNAVTLDTLPAPQVTAISIEPVPGNLKNSRNMKVTVRFDQLLDPKSANDEKNWLLEKINVPKSVVHVKPDVPFYIGSNETTVSLSNLSVGKYRFTIKGDLKNPFELGLNGSGMPGSDYVHEFEVLALDN